MRKATHLGECQLCGHTQKLPTGNLSLHGYAVKWNCFVGVCPGSRYLPLEISKDLIEDAIEGHRQEALNLRARAAKVREATETVWVHEYTYDERRRGKYVWRELPVAEVDLGSGYEAKWKGIDGKEDRTGLYAKDAAEGLRKLNGLRADAFEQVAKDHERYVEWQIRRLAEWKPRDLKPVDDTPKPVKCAHYETSRWGSGRVLRCRNLPAAGSALCEYHGRAK